MSGDRMFNSFLRGVKANATNMIGTDLRLAHCTNAVFSYAKFNYAVVESADFCSANFLKTDFRNVMGLGSALSLEKAVIKEPIAGEAEMRVLERMARMHNRSPIGIIDPS